jgi:hypothetical protein
MTCHKISDNFDDSIILRDNNSQKALNVPMKRDMSMTIRVSKAGCKVDLFLICISANVSIYHPPSSTHQ